MEDLQTIATYANDHLSIGEIPDYGGAHNGLQLENTGSVTKVAAAVDACLPVIRSAVDQGCDLLVVHHGMFWQGAQMITGSIYEKLKLAMDNNLAIYSAHIPLDVHPEIGNNALLAKAIGMNSAEPFFEWKGIQLGLRQKLDLTREELREKVREAVGGGEVHCCPGGPDPVGTVGVITGGAGTEVYPMAAAGIDTFITGEGPHWSFTSAEELGMNVIYGGHYATETFGVKALTALLAEKFGLAQTFIDHPTGL